MADKLVLFEDEIEGNIVETNDYIFDKIGEAVPIRTDDFRFDPQSSPSRPLAVSEKHGLVFVAHSSGFFVARTRDVMASAADIKEKGRSDASASSIQQLSVADVPLAKLHILALSTDNSTLAATADADIHFFSVGSLLDMGLEPSYSCSLDESSSVKDMQWTKKSENIYVVLSNLGKLYHGTVGGPLKDKMDNVDAVEWSSKGKLIAIARKDTLKILSSSFIEKSCMLLSFDSWIGDPDTNCIIKVDTIKWVRHDSIILGCFQLNADGNEENYLIQVIQLKDGKFTNESCKPVVISFYDMFSNLIDDILPSGSGPYLLLSYLEECELAITANRKNADQHVVYLSWSLGEESNEAVVVDIVRDNLKPRIELQENGDDNLIMGLCVDKISASQKVSVRLGMDQKELSPFCILICLTLDGKLIMYHVASDSDVSVKPASVSSVSDEEEDSTVLVPIAREPAKSELWKEQCGNLAVHAPSGNKNIKELDRKVGPMAREPAKVSDEEEDSSVSDEEEDSTVLVPIAREPAKSELWKEQCGNLAVDAPSGNKNIKELDRKVGLIAREPAKVSDEEEDSSISDEEEDSTVLVPIAREPAKSFPELWKEQSGNLAVDAPSGNKNMKELDKKVGLDVLTKDVQKSLTVNEMSNTDQKTLMLKKESTNNSKKAEPLSSSQSFQGQQELTILNPYLNKNGKQMQLPPVQENRNIRHASNDSFSQDGRSLVFRDLSKIGTQENVILRTRSAPFVEMGKMESAGLQRVSSQSLSSGSITTSVGTDVKSPLVPSTFIPGSISGTSTTLSFSGMPIENRGRKPSAVAGNIASVPPISSLSSHDSLIGKSFNHKMHPLKESYSELSQSRPNSEPSLSKKFGNMKEMTKELDMFLQSIEEPGGFRDACIVSQKSSVEELEREVGTLSERCRMWKSTMDERLNEVEHLFDMTVQVLARKIYMEGIVKQASDSRYWDFWSCQKLSSELELKRRHISKMNQDLTDQLIKLERHFNGLELNKFGENDGVRAGRSTLQSRFGHSRHIQSLHSLQSTMASQLAAADRLAECLSKQMVALKIESPSIKQKNVKKELFETIGIPYDASFSSPSPDVSKLRGTPKDRLSFSLGSSAAKDQPRRNVSAAKNYEPETARRRRDSLDRSWANYEPTKATVKRLLLQESGKVSGNTSSLSVDKQHIGSRLLEGSAVTRPRDHTMPATFFHPPESKGIQNTRPEQALENPATPFVLPKESVRQNLMRETNMTAEKSGEDIASVKKSESVSAKEKSVPSDTREKPSTFMVPTQTSSLLKKPNDMLNSYTKDGARPVEYSVKDRPLNTTVPSLESEKKHISPFSPSIPVSVAPSATFSLSVSATPSFVYSSSSAPLSSLSSSSSASASPSLSSVMPPNRPLTNSNTTADMNKPVSTSPVSAFPSPAVVPSGSFSLSVSKSSVPSGTSLTTKSALESQKTEVEPFSKTAVNSDTIAPAVESGEPAVESGRSPVKPSILAPLIAETPTSTAPGNLSSLSKAIPAPVISPGSQPSVNNTSGPTLNLTVNAQQDTTSAGQSLFTFAPSNSESVARTVDVQNAQEDDMDEEAPDTSSPAGLNLGSLGAFGLGSSPNPTAFKPNPFGGSFGNAATNVTTSPFPITVPSGELFQPASLNFQSLQPSLSSQPANPGAFASGFGTGTTTQSPSPSGFGQPSQVGPGQQALGSVLGAFGQSRQLGTVLPGTGFGSPGGFGGVASNKPPGGFSGAATGGFAGASSTVGGFAAVASGGGGFAALASGGGGFGGAAPGGGGFAGAASGVGGFAGAPSGVGGFGAAAVGGSGFGVAAPAGSGFAGANTAGGGFGTFGSQQGGFSAFGSGGTEKPPNLFQMRK